MEQQQQENIMTKKETIKQLMLLHEEFEKTRPTFTEQHLKPQFDIYNQKRSERLNDYLRSIDPSIERYVY